VRAIVRKGQAIFYGPPGTGKTFIAQHLAKHLISGGNGFYDLVQFHPSYSYEDFVQGIRPKSRDGSLSYPVVPGRFKEFCREAAKRNNLCVLIVDEINRADLSRVFGELMYLLEYREEEVPLAGGGKFRIPENVRLIRTMNTADRSIALVDHALRRRFAFLELYPDYDLLRKYQSKTGFPVEGLIEELRKLNRRIDDRHYEVGITFFLHQHLEAELEDIWRMEIEPYLEEYFFDRPAVVDEYRWERIGGTLTP
jgi:5-methylcytosine-specific restriction enzyme B